MNKGRFKKGQIPWNKGTKGKMPVPWNKGKRHVAIIGNQHGFKKDSTNKRTGRRRASVLFKKIKPCERCKKKFKKDLMVRHHRNGNVFENVSKNIQWLCRYCHPVIHNRWHKLKVVKN